MESVIFADADVVVVNDEQLRKLRELARQAPLRRARLCLHRGVDDTVHEMVIAFATGSYVRPHRHHDKSESFHVIEGRLTVILFDDDGRVMRRIALGPHGSERPYLYRASSPAWHTVLLETDSVILHETTNGPFVPGAAEYAPWEPNPDDPAAISKFLASLLPEQLVSSEAPGESAPSPSTTIIASAVPSMPHRAEPRATLAAIICNYNHGALVSRAIEAMLAQSRPADELLIVDDGSTDDSLAVIRSWVERHPHIRFLPNERNLGFHASLQRALAATECDYIYSGAADDHVLPGFFEGAMTLIDAHPETGVVCGQVVSVDPLGNSLSTDGLAAYDRPIFFPPARYLHDVLETEPPMHSLSAATLFHRQSLLDVGGMRADLGSWGDTFAIRAIGLQRGLCYWPHPAAAWTVNPGSMSQSIRSQPQRHLAILCRAAELMRSAEFSAVFPADHVTRWERRAFDVLVRQQLQPAIDGAQALQASCREAAKRSGTVTRVGLGLLRRLMTLVYLAVFGVMYRVTAAWLRRATDAGSSVSNR